MAQLSAAHAEEASAAEIAAARALAVDGLKLAQANNCAEAVPKLERAEKLYHSAVVASRLGECYVAIGRLVEGTEVLRKVLREPQGAEPAPALLKALERAQKVLDAAKPRIAGLTIKVVAVEGMVVKVDGSPVPAALVDTEMPTDPGEHRIDVTAPGFLRSGSQVTVAEGEKKTLTLTLTRDPNAAQAAAASAAAAAEPAPARTPAEPPPRVSDSGLDRTPPAPPAPREPNRTPAYVAFGVGGVALAAGGVLGFLTMKKHRELEDRCPNDVCAPQDQGDLDSAKTLGNVSTVAFGVGAAGVLLGTVLVFTAGPSDGADHATKARRGFAGLSRPRVAVGPTQVSLGADF